MAQYYFTVASLPLLTMDEQPFYSSREIAEICLDGLPSRKAYVVQDALAYYAEAMPDDVFDGILGTYHGWERGLRQSIANVRAKELGWELPSPNDDLDPESERIAREITGQDSPYDAETMLQRARWSKLNELSVGHYFDADRIVLYILQALVIERYRQMDEENGAERFNEIYSNMVQALSQRPE